MQSQLVWANAAETQNRQQRTQNNTKKHPEKSL